MCSNLKTHPQTLCNLYATGRLIALLFTAATKIESFTHSWLLHFHKERVGDEMPIFFNNHLSTDLLHNNLPQKLKCVIIVHIELCYVTGQQIIKLSFNNALLKYQYEKLSFYFNCQWMQDGLLVNRLQDYWLTGYKGKWLSIGDHPRMKTIVKVVIKLSCC